MTTGNHYFFRINNWFKNAETNLLSRYHLAHFELRGSVFQGIKEGVRILESSQLIKEVIIHIPEFHLFETMEMNDRDYFNLIHGMDTKKMSDAMDKCGMMISSGKTLLPHLAHPTIKADLHLSNDYFYISSVREIFPGQPVVYLQSEIFERSSLDFGSKTSDVTSKMSNQEKKIYSEFLKVHPLLAKSKATIHINEILDHSSETVMKSFDPPKIIFNVTHQFVFDKRIIPKKFHEYEVHDIMIDDYPLKYFPVTEDPMPLDIMFAPERYISFVNDNLELIRKELGNSSLTKAEALDALTGGFEKHIEWCKKVRYS